VAKRRTTGRAAAAEISLRPGSRGRVHEIYESLRERICLLRDPPGTLLSEQALAHEFGVSRTPIRQVLQRLEHEGLVETRNGVGTQVTEIDLEQLRDIYTFRMRMCELFGEFSTLGAINGIAKEIEALAQRANKLRHRRDFEEFWQINYELHNAINSAISSQAFREVRDRYYFQVSRAWFRIVDAHWDSQVEHLASELREIIKTIQARDPRAVGFVQRNYIAISLARITEFDRLGRPDHDAGAVVGLERRNLTSQMT
jgi:DNA-binding GntR family transcriptional regulator